MASKLQGAFEGIFNRNGNDQLGVVLEEVKVRRDSQICHVSKQIIEEEPFNWREGRWN